MFPYEDPIDVAELLELEEPLKLKAREIKELLGPQVSEDRREKIAAVAKERTYGVIPVLEGIYDRGNLAAVLRSAEAMGYQEVHFIDTQEGHKTSRRVTQGADKWVDLKQWENPGECIKELKKRGYKICVTHLEAAKPLREIDFTEPTALVFGNELEGVSEEMVGLADERCIIPMLGFVESYNISVAAALALYEAMGQRVEKYGAQGDLSPEELEILEAHFLIRALKTADLLLPALVRRGRGSVEESPDLR